MFFYGSGTRVKYARKSQGLSLKMWPFVIGETYDDYSCSLYPFTYLKLSPLLLAQIMSRLDIYITEFKFIIFLIWLCTIFMHTRSD